MKRVGKVFGGEGLELGTLGWGGDGVFVVLTKEGSVGSISRGRSSGPRGL